MQKNLQLIWQMAMQELVKKLEYAGAQSVGGMNLAASIQDDYLACSPVIALTGSLPQIEQNRHAYQEVDH